MNVNQVKSLLSDAYKVNDSILINGLHGIGKSTVVRQFAEENNLFFETLILSIKEPGDLLGMPDTLESENGKKTIWNEPDWFQRITNAAFPIHFKLSDLVFLDEEFEVFFNKNNSCAQITRKTLNDLYKRYYELYEDELYIVQKNSTVYCKTGKVSVLFLDELNRAIVETRQVSLQLVLEKELHSHKLPYINGVQTFIVAAINPADKYQAFELDIALFDRFTVIDMTVDVDCFLEYARENEMSIIMIDYISEYPDRLHILYEDGTRGPTPRSWEIVSRYLLSGCKDIYYVLEGRIGRPIALQFYDYYQNYKSNISLESIIKEISDNSSKDFIDIVEIITLKTAKLEAIRKKEIYKQCINLYKDDIKKHNFNMNNVVVLVLLYAFNIEITCSVLKELKNSDITKELYYGIVKMDETINNKTFFDNLGKTALLKI